MMMLIVVIMMMMILVMVMVMDFSDGDGDCDSLEKHSENKPCLHFLTRQGRGLQGKGSGTIYQIVYRKRKW